jgi:hypothetical protein
MYWLRASAQVDSSNPGLDVWSISWVAPVKMYWAKTDKGFPGKSLGTFKFDGDGIEILPGGSGTSLKTVYSLVTFTNNIGGKVNKWSSDKPMSVSLDFHFVSKEGNSSVMSFRQFLPNTEMLRSTAGISLDTSDGGSIAVAHGSGLNYIFDYVAPKGGPWAMYQGRPIQSAGGKIIRTHGSTGGTHLGGSSKPIFFHNDSIIYKVTTLHYA